MRGRFCAFGTACECGTAYLIQTESDGAHCTAVNTAEAISELYESLPGDEIVIKNQHGLLPCERLLEKGYRPF